jgi:outer membrane protein
MRAVEQAKTSKKKRTVFGALFCLALAIGPVYAAAPAVNPTPQQTESYEGMDETARVRLLIRLAKSGHHELARNLLERYPFQEEYAANRTLFVKGMVQRGRGDLKGAVALYREALADDPGLSLVRAELAEALAAMGDDDSAKHQLNRLLADASTDVEAQGIRAFIDRIDANRPFAFSSYFSVAPSTNINTGSDTRRVFDATNDFAAICGAAGATYICTPDDLGIIQNPKKSGIGLAAGGSVGFTHQLDSSFAFVAGAGMNARIYKDSAYSSLGISESLELRYLTSDGFFGVGAVGSQGLRTSELGLSNFTFGPRVSYQKQVSNTDRLNLSVVHEWRRFPDAEIWNGYTTTADGAWNHSFSADMGITLSAAFENLQAGLDYNSYQAYSAGLILYKELPKGVTLSLQGEYRYAHFNDIFDEGDTPEYNFVRQDHQIAAGATLTKRDWNIFGYAPSLRYSYAYNHSNVDIYTFDSHTVDFSFTKDF